MQQTAPFCSLRHMAKHNGIVPSPFLSVSPFLRALSQERWYYHDECPLLSCNLFWFCHTELLNIS